MNAYSSDVPCGWIELELAEAKPVPKLDSAALPRKVI